MTFCTCQSDRVLSMHLFMTAEEILGPPNQCDNGPVDCATMTMWETCNIQAAFNDTVFWILVDNFCPTKNEVCATTAFRETLGVLSDSQYENDKQIQCVPFVSLTTAVTETSLGRKHASVWNFWVRSSPDIPLSIHDTTFLDMPTSSLRKYLSTRDGTRLKILNRNFSLDFVLLFLLAIWTGHETRSFSDANEK
jgi:hypothetical protein